MWKIDCILQNLKKNYLKLPQNWTYGKSIDALWRHSSCFVISFVGWKHQSTIHCYNVTIIVSLKITPKIEKKQREITNYKSKY